MSLKSHATTSTAYAKRIAQTRARLVKLEIRLQSHQRRASARSGDVRFEAELERVNNLLTTAIATLAARKGRQFKVI